MKYVKNILKGKIATIALDHKILLANARENFSGGEPRAVKKEEFKEEKQIEGWCEFAVSFRRFKKIPFR